MNSTDMTYAGVSTATPPAVGLRCSALGQWTVRIAPTATSAQGTGLSGGAVRLRGLATAASTTGAPFGTDPSTFRPTTAPQGLAVAGVPAEHISTTPGDLPPEDPLS